MESQVESTISFSGGSIATDCSASSSLETNSLGDILSSKLDLQDSTSTNNPIPELNQESTMNPTSLNLTYSIPHPKRNNLNYLHQIDDHGLSLGDLDLNQFNSNISGMNNNQDTLNHFGFPTDSILANNFSNQLQNQFNQTNFAQTFGAFANTPFSDTTTPEIHDNYYDTNGKLSSRSMGLTRLEDFQYSSNKQTTPMPPHSTPANDNISFSESLLSRNSSANNFNVFGTSFPTSKTPLGNLESSAGILSSSLNNQSSTNILNPIPTSKPWFGLDMSTGNHISRPVSTPVYTNSNIFHDINISPRAAVTPFEFGDSLSINLQELQNSSSQNQDSIWPKPVRSQTMSNNNSIFHDSDPFKQATNNQQPKFPWLSSNPSSANPTPSLNDNSSFFGSSFPDYSSTSNNNLNSLNNDAHGLLRPQSSSNNNINNSTSSPLSSSSSTKLSSLGTSAATNLSQNINPVTSKLPLHSVDDRAIENVIATNCLHILMDAADHSLKAVELANTLRARVGTEMLALVREKWGGLLSLLEKHPEKFFVERIPKSDRVSLTQSKQLTGNHLTTSNSNSSLKNMANGSVSNSNKGKEIKDDNSENNGSTKDSEDNDSQQASRCLHVGNVPGNYNEVLLVKEFEKFGQLEGVKLITQKNNNRRFAFITYKTIAQAMAARHCLSKVYPWKSAISFAHKDLIGTPATTGTSHPQQIKSSNMTPSNSTQSLSSMQATAIQRVTTPPPQLTPFVRTTSPRPLSPPPPLFPSQLDSTLNFNLMSSSLTPSHNNSHVLDPFPTPSSLQLDSFSRSVSRSSMKSTSPSQLDSFSFNNHNHSSILSHNHSNKEQIIIARLCDDTYVPTQPWPIDPDSDPYFIHAIIDQIKQLSNYSITISKLRGFLKHRIGVINNNIKSVPLKALLQAYPQHFHVDSNYVSLIEQSHNNNNNNNNNNISHNTNTSNNNMHHIHHNHNISHNSHTNHNNHSNHHHYHQNNHNNINNNNHHHTNTTHEN